MDHSTSLTSSHKSQASVYSRLMGEMRKYASLNGMESASVNSSLSQDTFDWGDLNGNSLGEKRVERRSYLTKCMSDNVPANDSRRSFLEKEILDDLEPFPRSSLRYLPIILRDSYAMRQSFNSPKMGNARVAQIELRLRLRRPRKLPYFRDVKGAILILDMSGFTALGERLRLELGAREGAGEFARKVNTILSSMVNQVHKHNGDVLMFAGDALICLFMETDGENQPEKDKWKTLQSVKDCCLNVLGEVATTSEGDFTVHGGASYGLVRCFFLGKKSSIPGDCAFVVSGRPLRRAGTLLEEAQKGQVYIEGLGGDQDLITEQEGKQVFCFQEEKKAEPTSRRLMYQEQSLRDVSTALFEHTGMLSLDLIEKFDVHPFARAYISKLQARRADADSQNAMSILDNELRRVAIVFVGLRDLDYVDLTINKSIVLINDCFISLSHITHSCNGAVRDMLVDDKGCVFIAVFGAHSHEINPCFDATVCALRMQSALKALQLKKFSLGVSYGDCFCGEVGPIFRADFVVMGPEVNMAARLMAKAPNHGILVSKRIYSNANRDIQFTMTSKELKVKGKNESFHAYHPVLRKRRYSRVSSNYKGDRDQGPIILMPTRKVVFDKIYGAVESAKAGNPKLAYIVSAPFLGKSILIQEVSKKANQVLGFNKFRSFRTSLDSNTSYFPFRQILSSAMQQCASKIVEQTINNDVSAMSHLISCKVLNKTDRVAIGSILSSVIDPQLMSLFKGQNPVSLLKSLIESLLKIICHLQPLMMIFEGDGELDPSSWNLLSELMKHAKFKCPQLFVIIAFQEIPPVPVHVPKLRSEAIQLDLLPFDENETEIFIKNFLGIRETDVRIDKSFLSLIHDRSNGSPTFMEYIMTWALEKDIFDYASDGRTLILKEMDESSEDAATVIPRELSDIVLAPFNNLSPVLWDTLKIASCVGYSFNATVYGELKTLDLLPKIGLLTSDHDAFERCNKSLYKWKHQAVFEAVKSLLMTQQRIEIHKVIVKAFEERMHFFAISPNLRDEVHRLLARHCSLAEMWDCAFTQYMQAGEYAERNSNFSEAAKMYEEAISGQSNMANQTLSTRERLFPKIRLGVCLKEQANYKAAERILSQCLIEAERDIHFEDGDEVTLIHALTAMASVHQAQSKYHVATHLYQKVLPISRKVHCSSSSSSLWFAGIIAGYAETLRKSGDLPMAEEMHREALEIRHRAMEDQLCTEIEVAVSYTQLGCTLYGMGKCEEAYIHHKSALKIRIQYLDFSHSLVSESLNYCAECLAALGRADDALPLAMHAVDIRKNVFGLMHPALAHALSILASCYHKGGRSHDALNYLKNCLQICENVFDKNHANNIPNLISFAEVLCATGKYKKARSVYKQAVTIHSINFTADQKVDQLEKCKAKVNELTKYIEDVNSSDSISDSATLRYKLKIPPTDPDVVGTPVIILSDIGRDIDDEMSFVLLASLKRMCLLNPIAIVTTLSPQKDRALLARGCLDALGLINVPLGIGTSGGVDEGAECDFYGGNYSRKSSTIYEDGNRLFVEALELSPSKSVQFLCITSLKDAAKLLKEHEDLFVEKVKEVIIMGGLQKFEASEYLEPDSAFNNMCDIAATKYFYSQCQKLGIPTVTMSRWASHGCTVSSFLFDELAKTNHMIAQNIKHVCESNLMKLWEKVNLSPSDPGRESLPSFYDQKWFCQTFMGSNTVKKSKSIWNQIKKLNLYSPLALLACVPAFRETHFNCRTKMVGSTSHSVIGTSMAENGVVDATALYDEFFVLCLASYKNSLKLI